MHHAFADGLAALRFQVKRPQRRKSAVRLPLFADRLPPAVHRVAGPVAGQGLSLLFDLVVTSIPAAGDAVTLDGAQLEVYPLAAGQALVIGLSWYRDSAYVALLADLEGLLDVRRLADAIAPAAAALNVVSE